MFFLSQCKFGYPFGACGLQVEVCAPFNCITSVMAEIHQQFMPSPDGFPSWGEMMGAEEGASAPRYPKLSLLLLPMRTPLFVSRDH